MTNKILPLLPALLLLFAACNNTPGNQAAAVEAPQQLQLSKHFYKKLTGTIGGIDVVFDLVRKDSTLTGSYYYKSSGFPLVLNGTIDDNGNFTLTETDADYEETGSIKGAFKTNSNITGTWQNADKKKSLAVQLTVSEADNIASIAFETRHSEDCTIADRNRNNPIPDGSMWDTLCTSIDLELIRIKTRSEDVTRKINRTIERLVSGEEEGEQSPDPVGKLMRSVHSEDEDEFGYEYSVDCSVATNEENILCVQINDYQYMFGAAHPYSAASYYNFDLRSGKLIRLDDLMNANYRSALNRIGEKKFIKAHGREGWDFVPGKFELSDDFAILPGGLLFSFDPYEIGPYAAGAPDVFIPYKDIETLIKPGSIIPGTWLHRK